MTEPHLFSGPDGAASQPMMPVSPPAATPQAIAERLAALQAKKAAGAIPAALSRNEVKSVGAMNAPQPSGPAPGRILAAAASIAAGIGLVALMAGAQQDVVVQVNPTPVTVQPASVVVEMHPSSNEAQAISEVQVRVVEPATPAERTVPEARVVTQSEGS